MGLTPNAQYPDLLNITGEKDNASTGIDIDYHCELCCLALDPFQAFGGNQIMTMGLLFWISAGVICFAMMQTAFKLLLGSSDTHTHTQN
jgi:hypothetical protein